MNAASFSASALSYSSGSKPSLMMTCAPWAVAMPLASMCSSTTGASVLRRLSPPSAYQLRDVSPSSTSEPPSSLIRWPRARTRSASVQTPAQQPGSPAPWPQMMNSLAIAYSFPPTVTPNRASSHLDVMPTDLNSV